MITREQVIESHSSGYKRSDYMNDSRKFDVRHQKKTGIKKEEMVEEL
ncbi:MAG: hypothetical protein MR646_11875 [Agathobacter sp.]|nr:hypothetical protein [Agathobacter sp.]